MYARAQAGGPATFRGYAVRRYRQRSAHLPAERLGARLIRFAPHEAVVGLFHPIGDDGPWEDEEALEAAWREAGAPPAHLPDPAAEALILGEIVPLRLTPFAGSDALWAEEGALQVTARRAFAPGEVAARVEAYARERLLEAARGLVEGFLPRLPRGPSGLTVNGRLRGHTIGQCTRAGEILLAPCLARFPVQVLAATVAHELTHLTHFNHSPAFWRALTDLYPAWPDCDRTCLLRRT